MRYSELISEKNGHSCEPHPHRSLLLTVARRAGGVHRSDLLGDHTFNAGDCDPFWSNGPSRGRLRCAGHEWLRGGSRVHVVIGIEGDIQKWVRETKT